MNNKFFYIQINLFQVCCTEWNYQQKKLNHGKNEDSTNSSA